jgi:hypothetical protein
MVVEVLFALALITLAALVWVQAAASVRRANLNLADGRDATYAAEQVLLAMRSGTPAPEAVGAAKITVQPCDGGASVADHTWVYVEVAIGQQKHGLVGLVPTSTVKRGGQ